MQQEMADRTDYESESYAQLVEKFTMKFMSDYETFMIMLTFANLIVAILTYAHKK